MGAIPGFLLLAGLTLASERTLEVALPPVERTGADPEEGPQYLRLDPFEEVETNFWSGLQTDDTHVQEGQAGARWSNMEKHPEARTYSLATDWSPYTHLDFWAYSTTANQAPFMILLYSENPATPGSDYYSYRVTVDWTGWKFFHLPRRAFAAHREPTGWHDIHCFVFSAKGWDCHPRADTVLYFDALTLTREPDPADRLILGDMEFDGPAWKGLVRDTTQVREGHSAGKWADTVATRTVANTRIPHDWSAWDRLEFWLYSARANRARIYLVLYSDNPATEGLDYYYHILDLDWTGWKQWVLPRAAFSGYRQPVGWGQIDKILFSSDWNTHPKADTELYLDHILLARTPIRLEEAGLKGHTTSGDPHHFTYHWTLTAEGEESLDAVLSLSAPPAEPEVQVAVNPAQARLAPGESVDVEVTLTVPAAHLQPTEPLRERTVAFIVAPATEGFQPVHVPLSLGRLYYDRLAVAPHPRLFLTPEDLPRLQEKMRHPTARTQWAYLQRRADRVVAGMASEKGHAHAHQHEEEPETAAGEGAREGASAPHLHLDFPPEDLLATALAYRLTEESSYAAAAIHWLEHLVAAESWVHSQHQPRIADLQSAAVARAVALSYDWLYPLLTAAQREQIRAGLVRLALAPFQQILETGQFPATAYTNNWAAVENGGFGIAALALLGEEPQASQWLAHIAPNVERILAAAGTDGGWNEGLSYWGYAMDYVVAWTEALRATTGGQSDLWAHPYLQRCGDFPLYFLLPPASSVAFCDSVPEAPRPTVLWKLAAEYQRPEWQWLAEKHALYPPTAFDFLWYDPTVAAAPPRARPGSRHFAGLDWVTLRSSWDDQATVLALRSGGKDAHSHLDINSFVLSAFGEPLVVEVPVGGYADDYFDADQRWTHYPAATIGHNTILVEGRNQLAQEDRRGRIETFLASPGFDYCCADAREVYPEPVTQARRHVLFVRPDYFLMVDELAAQEPARFDWLAHPSGEVQVGEQEVAWQGSEAALGIQFCEPAGAEISVAHHERGEPYVQVRPPVPQQECRFTALLQPFKGQLPEGSPLAGLQRSLRPTPEGGWVLQVDRPGFRDTLLLEPASDPATGSRLAALTHRTDGPVAGWMVGRQERLDWAGQTYLEADQPITLAMAYPSAGEEQEITGQGQGPAARLALHCPVQPHTVRVNHRLAPWEYRDATQQITFAVPAGRHEITIR